MRDDTGTVDGPTPPGFSTLHPRCPGGDVGAVGEVSAGLPVGEGARVGAAHQPQTLCPPSHRHTAAHVACPWHSAHTFTPILSLQQEHVRVLGASVHIFPGTCPPLPSGLVSLSICALTAVGSTLLLSILSISSGVIMTQEVTLPVICHLGLLLSQLQFLILLKKQNVGQQSCNN